MLHLISPDYWLHHISSGYWFLDVTSAQFLVLILGCCIWSDLRTAFCMLRLISSDYWFLDVMSDQFLVLWWYICSVLSTGSWMLHLSIPITCSLILNVIRFYFLYSYESDQFLFFLPGISNFVCSFFSLKHSELHSLEIRIWKVYVYLLK